jgi:hypothetical protein
MPAIRPGVWRDTAENKTIIVSGTAIDETNLAVLILWREEHGNQVWAKHLDHWVARKDDGQKRFVFVREV